MLPQQFIGQNVHFAVNLFAALVSLAVFWLYFDSWLERRQAKELCKWVGFLVLALSFLLHAALIEQGSLARSVLGSLTDVVSLALRFVGYAAIIYGQLIDPLQEVPRLVGLKLSSSQKAAKPKVPTKSAGWLGGVVWSPILALRVLTPAGALASAWLYFRRATKGLERHLKPMALALLLVGLADVLSVAVVVRESTSPLIYSWVAPFGPLWLAEHGLFLAGIVVMGRWVWQYLVKRFVSQLFMIFTTVTMVIFLITTVGFTFLLVRNVEQDSLQGLETAANVLNYAIEAKKSELQAASEAVGQNPAIIQATASRDHQALASLSVDYLTGKKISYLTVLDDAGQVLVRAEDPERWGDSLSEDTLVRRALIGSSGGSVGTQTGVLAPQVIIYAATPVRNSNREIVGVVRAGLTIDDGFVDGVKRSTGLDSAIYGQDIRSASTLVAADGKSRGIGIKELNPQVQAEVLKEGKTFRGSLGVLNRPYLAAYAPLKDTDNTIVGMLFAGKPQSTVLMAASRSIELTFLIAVILILASLAPAYYIAKYLARQLD